MIGQSRFNVYVKYLWLSVVALITLLPIMITVMGGFKSLSQLRTDLFGLPNPVLWQNYLDNLDVKKSKFLLNLFNSSFVMIFTVIIDLTFSCLAGFALSRLKFLGRALIYNYFLLGLLFPVAVAILPLYMELKNIHLLNNYLGVILPQAAFAMPWHIMLARGFFMQIPKEFEEAATVDGCGPFRFFISIVIPLSTPVLTTIMVLTLVDSWNNFLLPLLVLDNDRLYTLPLGVMQFAGQYLYQWQDVLAYLAMAMVPAVIFYIFSQKYLIAGLTGGSIKQ